MQFKARKNFQTAKGKRYSANQIIELAEYEALATLEKANFKVVGGTTSELNKLNQKNKVKKDDDVYTTPTYMPPMDDYTSNSSWDSSSSDFGGFDGGDTGGGGADDDW